MLPVTLYTIIMLCGYATRTVPYTLVQSVITIWRICERVRWVLLAFSPDLTMLVGLGLLYEVCR